MERIELLRMFHKLIGKKVIVKWWDSDSAWTNLQRGLWREEDTTFYLNFCREENVTPKLFLENNNYILELK